MYHAIFLVLRLFGRLFDFSGDITRAHARPETGMFWKINFKNFCGAPSRILCPRDNAK